MNDEENLKNLEEQSSADERQDEDDGKVPCPYCHKRYKHLAKHTPHCRSKSENEKDLKMIEKQFSTDERQDEDDGKVPCPYCHKRFKHLAKHTPHCRSKSENEKDLKMIEKQFSTDERQDEDDGKVPCPYCHKRFKHLAKHTPHCRSKSENEENLKNLEEQSSADERQNEDDGKVPCPYCHKRFKHLAKHTPHCRSKSEGGKDLKMIEQSSADERQDEDDGKVTCPYCHKRFKHLAKHTPHCRSKSDNEENLKNVEEQSSADERQDEDDGKVAKYTPHCRTKLDDEENFKKLEEQSSADERQDEDDGKVPCPYCHKRFKHLAKHTPHCRSKSESEIALKMKEIEDAKKKPCPYCHGMFKRIDLHKPYCKSKEVANPLLEYCQYCNKKFERVQIHKCPLQPQGERNFNDIAKSVMLKRNDDRMKIVNDTIKRIKDHLNDEMDKEDDLSWDVLNTGSYYSLVKVSDANEFDYMFCPTLVQCRIEPNSDHPCHCKVFITNKEKLPDYFTDILESSGEIIPSKYKDFCFNVFDSIVKDKRHFERIKNESSSPAYTVEYKYKVSENTTKIDIDWVPCLKVQNVDESFMEWKTRKLTEEEMEDGVIYVVAKEPSVDDKLCNLWRLSYSVFEKKIIREKCKHDDHQLIRIIKKILEEVKNDETKICSYHIVTHCLHSFEEIKKRPELKQYTIDVINLLIDRLDQRFLPHFFIPKFNLLKEVSEAECQKFIEKLKYYIKQWTKE